MKIVFTSRGTVTGTCPARDRAARSTRLEIGAGAAEETFMARSVSRRPR
ncbi:hypothetical protein K2Z84_28430 [Candidatus Binatia bacterium]|nr:hypothetical protein [Candidatus Binatia bacterium]